MKCPICGNDLVETESVNKCNGYEMYVVEDSGDCVEYFDGIKMFKCSEGHNIYISIDDIK